MSDQRSSEKQLKATNTAIDKVLAARRAIVDVRLDRKAEDELLRSTMDILDRLEEHRSTLDDTEERQNDE